MTNEQQELEDEYGAQFGDPRRCPTHGLPTSSPCGTFDAPCGACEAAMDEPCLVERLAAGTETQADLDFVNAEFADAARDARRSRWVGVRR